MSMNRLFFISIFILTSANLFGQTSHATASATIVTPVGAEISGEINDVNFFSKNVRTRSSDVNIKNSNPDSNRDEEDLSFLTIIGEIFSHHVTVETLDIFKGKKETEEILTARKHELFVSITVNFD